MKKNNSLAKPMAFTCLFSIGIGLLYYLILDSYIHGLIAGAISLAFAFGLILPLSKKYLRKRAIQHENYRFLQGFCVNLATTNSIEQAYEAGLDGCSMELRILADSLMDRPIEERMNYLYNYFGSDSYKMLLSLYGVYSEQGGDFLKMSSGLLSESSREEESGNELERGAKRIYREFLVLWFVGFLIIGVLRISLNSFMSEILSSWAYSAASYAMLLVLLIAIYLFAYFKLGEPLKFKFRRK